MEVRTPRRSYLTGIGYTSLTDIVLLLLIFFLLSSSFVLRPGLHVRLPEGETTQETPQNPVTVTVTTEGQLFVDQRPVSSFEALEAELRRRAESRPTVVLEAERDVALEHAVHVLDLARQAGMDRLVIASEPTRDD